MKCFPLLIAFIFTVGTARLEPTVQNDVGESVSTLKLLHILFRHGDRTPIRTYPTDPYKDPKYWPAGWGQLTNTGKARHYGLGQWVRARYSSFLPVDYHNAVVQVRSTDVDRTLMSAMSHLAGLYPPKGDQVWNLQIPWQPIPVHTRPESEDYALRLESTCPVYDDLVKEFNASPYMQKINKDNADLYELLTNLTGGEVRRLEDVEYLYDVLFIESRYNYTLPDWAPPLLPRIKALSDLNFGLKAYTTEMQKLKGGPLVQEMVQHWDSLINGSLPKERKFFIYSAHDVTVAMFLSALGLYNGIQPPYASLVMVELHQTPDNGKYFIKILYKNSTEEHSAPIVLSLPNCTAKCDLSTFKSLTAPIRVPDIITACGSSPGPEPWFPVLPAPVLATLITLCFAGAVLLAMAFSVSWVWIRNRRTHGFEYFTVQAD